MRYSEFSVGRLEKRAMACIFRKLYTFTLQPLQMRNPLIGRSSPNAKTREDGPKQTLDKGKARKSSSLGRCVRRVAPQVAVHKGLGEASLSRCQSAPLFSFRLHVAARMVCAWVQGPLAPLMPPSTQLPSQPPPPRLTMTTPIQHHYVSD